MSKKNDLADRSRPQGESERSGEKIVSPNFAASETSSGITVSIVADDKGFREALAFQLVTARFDVSAHPSAEELWSPGALKRKTV